MNRNHKTVLVVAAHPDDEVLGCGGTIAGHARTGDKVCVLFLSEGVSSRSIPGEEHNWSRAIEAREAMAIAASTVLQFTIAGFLRHPNLRMRDQPVLDLVKQIDAVIREVRPDVIYTHHPGDMNSDHGIAFEATLTACRPRNDLSVKQLYAFETPSSTEWASPLNAPPFLPNYFVDIKSTMDAKLAAARCYDFEMRDFPHPRSAANIRALAQIRAAQVGLELAEAFALVRAIRDGV